VSLKIQAPFPKAASYIFTNSKPLLLRGLRALGAMEDVESMDQLIASGANLRYNDKIFFSKTKTGILSPNQVTLPRL
jgi:hypothetical protein